ncbi:MAG TPA: acetate kinase [Polyangiaceae bacterium]|nr:acetate kinase [Polyangiaceae bacterium]
MSAPNVLVINCGSSSLKFALIEPVAGRTLSQGLAERLNTEQASLRRDGEAPQTLRPGAGHGEALDRILSGLGAGEVSAVGHRVVHGGEAFSDSVVLDAPALQSIEAVSDLAPLHNPANLLGIRAARERYPSVPHVAVFDTAFHQTLPRRAFLYAVPYELYERHQVRRYGFHGTSHRYVAGVAAERLGKPLKELELVTAHLGNGCSACAVSGGKSVDTTMGLTPLEGLVMGTRSGDVDPNLHEFLVERTGLDLAGVTELFNRKSGLLGLSGSSNDMRTLLERSAAGDDRATIAIDVFCYRLAKAVLALSAALERVDALVFTGGIGEHAAPVREKTLSALRPLGPSLDAAANARHGADSGGRITGENSRLLALVVPTQEELVIARETARLTFGT